MTAALEYGTPSAPLGRPRHLKVTGPGPAFGFEPCEDVGCTVGIDGKATSCGRPACPACACSGTNLSRIQVADVPARVRLRCRCGYSWVREDQLAPALPQH